MIPEQLQHIQLLMNILLRHRRQAANLCDARRVRAARDRDWVVVHHPRQRGVPRAGGWDLVLGEQLDDDFPPVLPVAEEAKVGERFFGAAELALAFAQLVAESNEKSSQALSLVLWQRQNARDVVPLAAFLLLAEISYHVAAALVARGHHVEQEGVDVVVEGFMVQEQFT